MNSTHKINVPLGHRQGDTSDANKISNIQLPRCSFPLNVATVATIALLLLDAPFVLLATSSVTAEPAEGKVTYVSGQPISLRCSSSEHKEFKWYKSREIVGSASFTPVTDPENILEKFEELTPQDDDIYEIRNERLKIPKPNATFIRDYMCHALNEDKSKVKGEYAFFKVRPQPYIVDFDIATSHTRRSGIVTDGDRLEIQCSVRNDSQGPIDITWLKSRLADDEQTFEDITNSSAAERVKIIKVDDYTRTLLIESVTLSDRAHYMCMANNQVTNVTSKIIFIRVKDKLIALWPFVGIVTELAILFSVIFIYEHQRAATDRDA